jgi:PST family polysaccharide transporter
MNAPKSRLSHEIFAGILWTCWGKGARTALQFVVLILLARLMTPHEFGVVGAALIIVGFSEIFTKIGLGPAIVQREDLEPRHLKTAAAVSLLLSVMIAVVIWLLAPYISTFFGYEGMESVIEALTFIFPIRGIGLVAESLAQRELNFKMLATTGTVSFFIGYFIVGIGLALMHFGVWALVAANLATSVVRVIPLLWLYPPTGFAFEKKAFNELIYFSGGYTIARVANYGALQLDYVVVGHWLGLTALGFYGRAYQLMSVPASTFGQILDDVLFPSMAKIQNDRDRLGAIYLRGVSLIALVMLPISVVGLILAPEIVRAALGWKWASVVIPFQILLVGLLMRTSYKMSDSLTRAKGAVYNRAWRQVIYAGLVFGGAVVGQKWGINGVAVGVLVAVTINFLLMAQMSLTLLNESWWDFIKAHGNAALLATCAGLVTYPTVAVLRDMDLSAYATLAIMGLILGVFLLLVIRFAAGSFLGKEGIWMLGFLKSYGRNKFGTANAVGADSSAG